MIVFSVNRVMNWCQIFSGKTYTCPIKEINGETFFRFKKQWHPVSKYIVENAAELIKKDGKLFSIPFTK